MNPLPIDAHLEPIANSLETHPTLLLQAQPGTGKTTRVPARLLESSFCQGKQVWVLEPRRLAAKLAARRVAQELGEELGETVGYQFRFEKVAGPRTRLRFLTEGMLLRHLLGSPQLEGVGAVVLDEFHERNLQGDLALALLKRLQQTTRPDLRLVIMSATLSVGNLETYLGSPAQISIAAPHHSLQIQFSPSTNTPLEKAVARSLKETLASPHYPGGDFLVFLPGMAEIRKCADALAPLVRERGLALHLLHGDLSKEEQDQAVCPGPSTKVILSTNIAESSLTIEGVNVVIDSGLQRVSSTSSWSGLASLRTRTISRASAIQRAGRAARTGPGLCVRLYSAGEFDHWPSHETPEILRADLTQTLLELKALSIIDESKLDWYEAPPSTALQNARHLLYRLGALNAAEPGAAITPLGEKIAKLPVHPRLARVLLEARERGCLGGALRLAALISEGQLQSLDALEDAQKASVPRRALEHLQSFFPEKGSGPYQPDALAQSLLTGFSDRVGKLRDPSETELILATGGSVSAPSLAGFREKYFLILDARETQDRYQNRTTVRGTSVVALEPEWLFDLRPLGVTDETQIEWDAIKKRVSCRQRLKYESLTLEESESAPEPNAQTLAILLRAVFGITTESAIVLTPHEWIEKLSVFSKKEKLEKILARRQLAQELHACKPLGETLLQALSPVCSWQELTELDWESVLGIAHALQKDLPESITLPGGRKVEVQYALGRPPWIESRLQDFFGMKQGPKILGGKLALTLHLLAPNYRAVQVTTDLEGFWKNTYPTVKKELSRNYPRHSWPDDPATAKPPAPKPPRR